MSTSTAELTLVIRARNLANSAIESLGTAVETIKTKAQTLAGAFKTAFAGMGTALSIFASDIAHGEDLKQAAIDAGLFMGFTLVGTLGEDLGRRFASSEILEKIGARLAILGASIGTALDLAIGIGMAAAPAIIIGALAAAVFALVTNKDLRDKFILGGQTFVKWLVDGMIGIGKALLNAVTKIPGAIADFIRGIKIDIGPFHLSSKGFSIDPPSLNSGPEKLIGHMGRTPQPYDVPGKATGGWVGLNGPQLVMTGERGPEYVRRAGTGTGDGGSRIIQLVVSGKVLAQIVDEENYKTLRRAAATSGPI